MAVPTPRRPLFAPQHQPDRGFSARQGTC